MNNTKLSVEKIDEIIECAISEFAENGKKGASIKRIAEKSGLSVGVIYKYFDSKDALFDAALDKCFRELEREIKISTDTSSSLTDLASSLIDAIVSYAKRKRSYMNLYFSITGGDREEAKVLAERLESISHERYSSFIKEAQERDLIRKDIDEKSLSFFFDSLLMMVQFSLAVPYYEKRAEIYLSPSFDLDKLKKDLVKILSSAMGEMDATRT